MPLSQEKQGEIIIFAETILWASFPVVTLLTYSSLSPLTSLAWSTLFAGVFFAIILCIKKKWHELLKREAFFNILMGTIFIGILYYTFFFWGLQYTSAGNGGIIGLMEIFFSFLFFNIWKKEYMDKQHLFGVVIMFFSGLLIMLPKHTGFQIGDLLILAATMMAPMGNYFQKKARKQVCTETIMFIRSLIAAPFVFLLAFLLGSLDPIAKAHDSLLFLIINGAVLLGFSKILWIESIHRISVTKALALTSVGPFFTLIYAFFLLKEVPNFWQLCALVPMIFGTLLLTQNNLFKKKKQAL